ncbi:lipase [Paenibacillus sp. LMG 31461]|uniref:Lipase n=1 Tax=Paenibacillus plantarum TaxID=2654975 RepID=A0ABX1X9T1_9BACL|nr:SGNH/GDSL hydrolase family protein [Paenibacillus plantarum]NOU64831.1 lipase [Paenibacillus plantarum]
MIREHMYLHNVTEVEKHPTTGELQLYRFPKHVRHVLGDRGRIVSEEASGCEIRFVTEAPAIRITLCLPETDGDVFIFKGGLFHSQHRLNAGVRHTLHLEAPNRIQNIDCEHLMQSGFAPEVWRIFFGRTTCLISHLQTFGYPVRPPQPNEMPTQQWLAYGSSITHGMYNQPMTYIQQAARRLSMDVYNCGLSGSCLCEKEVADFLADRQDWQIATLELGVNMRDRYTVEQFHDATDYLLKRLITKHPDKPIFVITIYPNIATYNDSETTKKDAAFNEVLRAHVRKFNHPNLHLIEGDEILDDFSGLSVDLVHPGEYGHMRMAYQLAEQIKKILNGSNEQN